MLSSVKRMLQAETSLRGNPPLGRLSLLKKLPQQPDSPDISHRPRYGKQVDDKNTGHHSIG